MPVPLNSPRWTWVIFALIALFLAVSGALFIDVESKRRDAEQCVKLLRGFADFQQTLADLVEVTGSRLPRIEAGLRAQLLALERPARAVGVGDRWDRVHDSLERLTALTTSAVPPSAAADDIATRQRQVRREAGRAAQDIEFASFQVRNHLASLVENRDREWNYVFAIASVSWLLGLLLALLTHLYRRDIARRQAVEVDLQRTKEAAEAANRAKDQFLAVLSHELRTPLTPVLAGVSAWLDDGAVDPELRDLLDMVRRNVALEARLIDDLLDLSRIGHGALTLHPEVVDAHAVVHRALETCAGSIEGKDLDLRLDFRATSSHVHADPARLQQVLWNLIQNAVKFTPTGGRLTIQSSSEDGQFVLEVADTGIGIDSEALPRIFEPFEQGRPEFARRYGGLGLGLAICRSTIEAHGGRLTASSPGRDRGSRFTLRMAAVAPLQEPRASVAREEHGAKLRPLEVLLVEDNADTRRFLARILERNGHRVATADSIQSAVTILAERPIDLIVTDLDLPDGNGLSLVRREVSDQMIPTIVLSGYGSNDDIELSREAGCVDHLVKPVDAKTLDDAMRRVMGGLVRGVPAGS
jgi:signal transduction histidine kinase/ActR/RegA family two-component response regulator